MEVANAVRIAQFQVDSIRRFLFVVSELSTCKADKLPTRQCQRGNDGDGDDDDDANAARGVAFGTKAR